MAEGFELRYVLRMARRPDSDVEDGKTERKREGMGDIESDGVRVEQLGYVLWLEEKPVRDGDRYTQRVMRDLIILYCSQLHCIAYRGTVQQNMSSYCI
jgi:hypothetical protein